MADDDDFDQEMHHADWQHVYERQATRSDLIEDFVESLGLRPESRVLELGCGPGYLTAQLAERVSRGTVVALDRHREALRFLRAEAGVPRERVRLLVGDVGSMPLRFGAPMPTLAVLVLHHTDTPERAINELAGALVPTSPVLIVEYHPEAPAEVGPPTDARIAPETIRSWLEAAGFTIDSTDDLPEEKYAIRCRR